MTIAVAGLVYAVSSELHASAHWHEEKKVVDFDWMRLTKLGSQFAANNVEVRFARPDRLATLIANGAEVIYEIDATRQVRRALTLVDGSLLIAVSNSINQ